MPLIVDAHLDWMRQRGLSEATVYDRMRALARLSAFTGGPACEATPADLAAWRAQLRLSPEATVVYVSHARQFFAWAVRAGLLDSNPADGLPVPRQGRRLPRPIADEPLFHAVASAGERVRPWLVLAGWAGLRAKEIARLRRDAVLELARPPVIVVRDDATKGRTERIVPMSEFVLQEIVPQLPSGGWVFRRRDGQPGPNTAQRISQLANWHLHACGISATLHQLRHRFLTGAWHLTKDLRLVQELAGHASPTTTAGYTAYDNADALTAVQGLPVPRHLRIVSPGTKKEA